MRSLLSEERYEKCKRLSEELLEVVDNDFDRVELLRTKANCISALDTEQYSKSLYPLYYEALILARKVNHLFELIQILTSLSLIEYFTLKNTEKAIEYLTECLEKSKELNDPYYIESTLIMLARVYYDSDNYFKALALLEEALLYLDHINEDYVKD